MTILNYATATNLHGPDFTAGYRYCQPDLIMETYNNNINAITSAAISNANLRNILEKDRRDDIDPNTARRYPPWKAGISGQSVATAVRFEPVVLFKNGAYYGPADQPLDQLDLAQDKRSRPKAWGQWQKKGDTFLLTDAERHVSTYKLGSGNWFPAYAYSASVSLKRAYNA